MWKLLKGQMAGEWVTKKCRHVGHCILELKVRLASASPRQRGQPAGLGREPELMGTGTSWGCPGHSNLLRGGFPLGRGGKRDIQSVSVDCISPSGRIAVTICLCDLGQAMHFSAR